MTNNQCQCIHQNWCHHSPTYKTPQGCSKCFDEQVQQQNRLSPIKESLLNFDMAKVIEKLDRLNLIEAFLEMDDEMLQKIMLLK